jgi:hypothetical protein
VVSVRWGGGREKENGKDEGRREILRVAFAAGLGRENGPENRETTNTRWNRQEHNQDRLMETEPIGNQNNREFLAEFKRIVTSKKLFLAKDE